MLQNIDSFAQHACACMGPQDGEPLCPCAMRYVKIVNGRYISTSGEDLGPDLKIPKSHYEDLTEENVCHDLAHNPHPKTMDEIPMDKIYVHVCKTCKAEHRLMPNFAREFFKELFHFEGEIKS